MPSPPRPVARCPWPGDDPIYVAYHDTEWGVPERDDRALFEKLLLDGFQAGLSWITILRKRDRFREAFDRFDPDRIARWRAPKVARLMADPGIVRNRAKIEASVSNARAYLALRDAGVAFGELVWSFVGGAPRVNHWRQLRELPAETAESRAMSKALRDHGMKFVGPTICYAFMQATGMVDDHLVGCFRHGTRQRRQRSSRSRSRSS
jgi:DNA-3-methyladenine glycosylase I